MVERHWRAPITEGVSGDWAIEQYDVIDGRTSRHPVREVDTPDGRYTQLRCGDDVWMVDTPKEKAQHAAALDATGRVLVTGLGLGVIADWLLQDPAVDELVVVERSSDVSLLVAPSLHRRWGRRFRLRIGDAFTATVPGRFDFGWHDIWRSEHNVAERAELVARYAHQCARQACWPTGGSDVDTVAH